MIGMLELTKSHTLILTIYSISTVHIVLFFFSRIDLRMFVCSCKCECVKSNKNEYVNKEILLNWPKLNMPKGSSQDTYISELQGKALTIFASEFYMFNILPLDLQLKIVFFFCVWIGLCLLLLLLLLINVVVLLLLLF